MASDDLVQVDVVEGESGRDRRQREGVDIQSVEHLEHFGQLGARVACLDVGEEPA